MTRVVDLASGADVGLFRGANATIPSNVWFTPGNETMIEFNSAEGFRQWDLKRIQWLLQSQRLELPHLQFPVLSQADYDHNSALTKTNKPLTIKVDLGDWEQTREQDVLDHYNYGIEVAPHLAVRWYFRGVYHYLHDNEAHAIADLEESLRCNHEIDTYLLATCKSSLARWLACAQPPLQNVERALTLANECTQLLPGDWRYVLVRGIANHRAGNHDQAIADWQKCIANGDEQITMHARYNLALLYRQQGHEALAQENIERVNAWRDLHEDELSGINRRYLQQIDHELEQARPLTRD